jgi:hypothetical protein
MHGRLGGQLFFQVDVWIKFAMPYVIQISM